MRKAFLLFAVAVWTSLCFAESHEKIIWHRSYFISIGLDASLSLGGHLDGKSYMKSDGDEGIFIPSIGSFPLPLAEIGVNFNQHTVAVSFGMWNIDVNYGKGSDYETGNDANYWRFAAEYRYYFFWPEDFQIGPGLAYSFSRLSVHDAAIGMDKYSEEFRESAVFAANAFALSANMRYKIRPFGMDIAVRYRPHFIRSVSTSSSGYNDLSETLWHHSLEIGGRVFYEF